MRDEIEAENTRLASQRRASESVGRALLAIASTAAAAAAVAGLAAVADADPEVLMLETWRAAGLGVFAGLFALLAYRPRHYAGVWELVVLNKLVLTVVALTYGTGSQGADEIALYDGILTAGLLAAYLLCRGWRAWSSGWR
jgi:hypothetical protein